MVGEPLLAQVEDPVTGAPVAFGLVHGGVGVLKNLIGHVAALAGERDTDAGGDLCFDPGEHKG